MLTILFVILLFGLLVLVHEWGHFVAARRNGVEVEEFGIGFPPKVYGIKKKGVLYSINLLPLGGFVRLKGEDQHDNTPGSFGAAKLWAKSKILLAGVGMNLVAAFVLLYVLCVTGLPGLGGGLEPTFLKSSYDQPKQLVIAQVGQDSPAEKAGLKRGDYILNADGQAMATDTDLSNYTAGHAGQPVVFKVRQGGQERDITVTLRPPGSSNGYLGVSSQQVYKLQYDPLRAVVAAGYITISLLVATVVGVFNLLIHLPSLLGGIVSGGVPEAAQAASGPVGIIYIMQSLSSLGWSYLVLLLANISVALAAFNALPLPALDGGRLAVLLVQRVTGRTWSAEAEARYHTIGFIALIGLIILISVYDLRKFF